MAIMTCSLLHICDLVRVIIKNLKMKRIALFVIAVLAARALFAQQPQRGVQSEREAQPSRREVQWVNPAIPEMQGLVHHVLHSASLGHEVGYVVYTPEGYSEKAKKRYPVIYFLHGAGGNESSDAAGFSSWAIRAMESGVIPPVICVFPNGGRSGYRGEVEKMITAELIPAIDKNYRTIAKSKGRVIAGFSMGGAGSVYLSIQHPALFAAVGSMGGGMRNQNEELAEAISFAIPVWRKNKVGFFMVNGDNDRPDAFAQFAAMLTMERIENQRLILPDTNHNLGLYYERSVFQLLAFIGEYL